MRVPCQRTILLCASMMLSGLVSCSCSDSSKTIPAEISKTNDPPPVDSKSTDTDRVKSGMMHELPGASDADGNRPGSEVDVVKLNLGQGSDVAVILPNLKSLPNLTELSLMNSGVVDDQLANLVGLKLTRLTLTMTSISDAGVKHLSELTTLEELDLLDSKVTGEGVAKLKDKLPQCEILSDHE